MVCLLMTRPEAASQRFWHNLPEKTRASLQLVISPLLEIRPLDFDADISGYDGVIFSSANAVACVPASDMTAFCVGEQTTEAAKRAGWRSFCLGRTAEELTEALLEQKNPGKLLHFHGVHMRMDISKYLRHAGHKCDHRKVYDQVLMPLNAQAQNSLNSGKQHIVPLFSPRTARQFVYECDTATHIFFAAMSDAVAEPLKSLSYMELQISKTPDAASMTELVRNAADRLA